MTNSYIKTINSLYLNQDNLYRSVIKKLNMSTSVFWILYFIRSGTVEPYQSAIVKNSDEPKQTINSSLKNLENNKIISLINEGKKKKIVLTPKGVELCKNTIDKTLMAENIAYNKIKNYKAFVKGYTELNEELKKEFDKI